MEPLIELTNITKYFGSIRALDDVSIHVDRGEVVGLIGDNGAGKSTLINILAGVYAPSSGQIIVRGQPVKNWDAAKSRDAGIETVFQDRALCVQQSIVWNIFMGREITRFMGFLNVKKQMAESARLMRDIGFTSRLINATSTVGTLSGGERQGVAIARAIYNEADLIILDEPTTALSLTETEKVFSFINAAKDRGRSVLFIGHNIYHVYDIADRFIVLDRGQAVLEATKSQIGTTGDVIRFMRAVAAGERPSLPNANSGPELAQPQRSTTT